MNSPKYSIGQKVDARDDRGSWMCGGEVIEIKATYAYRIKWPPMPGMRQGGEIIEARFYEYGVHGMRASRERSKDRPS